MLYSIKRFAVLSLALGLVSQQVFADAGSCQHPYCNGPDAPVVPSAPYTGPRIVNPGLCYQGNCYPGAYAPAAPPRPRTVSRKSSRKLASSVSPRLTTSREKSATSSCFTTART